MAFVPTLPAGHVMTAPELQTITDSINGITAFKSTLTSRASTTTLADDPVLFLPALANATYQVSGFVLYTSAVEVKFAFQAPAGTVMDWVPDGLISPNTTQTAERIWRVAMSVGDVTAVGCAGASFQCVMLVTGRAVIGASGGNLRLQWAQNTSSATATTINARSWLHGQRLA